MTTILADLRAPPDGAVAVEDGSGGHRWGALRAQAALVASGLRARLPAPGAHVGLLLDPGAAWVIGLLAVLEAGAVAVPLSRLLPPAERRLRLDDCEAALVIAPADLADEPGAATLEALSLEATNLSAPSTGRPADAAAEDTALLLYTSGTTGRPKGARLTHGCLGHQVRGLADAWGLGPSTLLVHALPLHHMHGIAIALLPVLAAGGSARMLPRFSAPAVWDAFAGASAFMAVPTMYHRLLEAFEAADAPTQARWRNAARALQLTTSGSAPMPGPLAERWEAIAGAIPLERYGMTETGVICSNPREPSERRRGWVGPPLAGMELRLVGEDGEVAPRGPDGLARGDIEVRGPSLFSGYHGEPARGRDWFATGDVGEKDERGWIRLRGRRSTDILKSGGYKLSALAIEEVLREHPAVIDVSVVGLPHDALGEEVAALVVARPGLDTGELVEFARARLPRYALPRRVVSCEELPRNALGKVIKRDVIALLSE